MRSKWAKIREKPCGTLMAFRSCVNPNKRIPVETKAFGPGGTHSRFAVWLRLFFLVCLVWRSPAQAPLPLVSFYYSNNGFGETNGNAFLGIHCDHPPVTVRVEYSGTATPNLDYTDAMGAIPNPAVRAISMSENSAVITFTGKKDFIEEPNESLVVRILPDPSYVISAPGGVTFTITNQLALPNVPPRALFKTMPSLIQSQTNLPISVTGWDVDGTVNRAEIYANSQLLTNIVAKSANRTNVFLFSWVNPPAGIYNLTATVFDDLGASGVTPATPLTVANQILPPVAGGSVTSSNFAASSSTILTSFSARGVLEWNIPASATNQQGFIQFQSASVALHYRLWIYEANGASISSAVLQHPRDYAGSLPHGTTGLFTVDVTPWISKLAGTRLGFLIEADAAEQLPDVSRSGTQAFNSFSLVLMPPNSYELPPRVRWLSVPRQVPYGAAMTIRGEILAPGWTDLSAAVADEWGPLAVATFDQRGDLTNTFSVTLTNFSVGPHYLRGIAFHGATNYTGETALVLVTPPDIYPHDYIQTTGLSGSFMIVDMAGRAHVWGRNDQGQLGLGFHDPAPVSSPVTLLAPEGRRWKGIASAGRYSAGFTDDGSYWSWGNLAAVGLAASTDTPQFHPVPVDADGVAKIIGHENQSLFLDQKRRLNAFIIGNSVSLYGTGVYWDAAANTTNIIGIYEGQINDFRGGDYFPLPPGRAWKTISTAANHSLALTTTGELYAWGQNAKGELPFVEASNVPKLVMVTGVAGWTQMAAGNSVNLAVDKDGRLWAWGNGITGSPDAATNKPGKVLVPANIKGWLDVAVTDSMAMALARDGRFFVWGNTGPGILPDKTASVAMYPELIATFPNISNPEAHDIFVSFASSTNLLTGKVQILGPVDVPIPIQASSDLENWTTTTNLANPMGRVDWTAPLTAENRFYRVRGD